MPLPFWNEGGIVVSPPVYSGIVPSLLPAFSAPTAVSVVPSCLASSAEIAAHAAGANAAASAATIKVLRNMILFSSKCGLERERHPAAVGQSGERAVGCTHDAARGGLRGRVGLVVAEVAVVAQLE